MTTQKANALCWGRIEGRGPYSNKSEMKQFGDKPHCQSLAGQINLRFQPLFRLAFRPMKLRLPFSGRINPWIHLTAVVAAAAMARPSRAGADDLKPLPPPVQAAMQGISAKGMLDHIKVLSSDEFEGRQPGSAGEDKTIAYLEKQFKALGLSPGNTDGTYLQAVPLMGFTATPTLSITTNGGKWDLGFPADAVIWSRRFQPEVKVENSEIVFVGYGVVAPEYGWDDYKDVDVKGKTIVMLVNDPQVPDPNDLTKLDDSLFKGRTMTYYGRWTYKYEIATAKGAAAAIVVHETGPAGYPWAVVVGSNSRENFDLQTPDRNQSRVAIEGWMTLDNARKLCAAGGQDYNALKAAAVRKDFRPVSLKSQANFTVANALRPVSSHNVVAVHEGSDPKLKNEYLIYTAHWDHLGKNPKLEGDQIFNGAVDNASGTAALLELARAYAHIPTKRSVMFLSVTAEEKGLLGSKYYAANPIQPLNQTIANLNMDSMNVWGPTHDVTVVGVGQSTLEDWVQAIVTGQGREVKPESEPQNGSYFRSDHFEFAKKGVPALYVHAGTQFIGKTPDFGKKKHDEYTQNDYHKVTDEIKPDWDLSGAVEEAALLFQLGYRVAENPDWPEWKPGSEFKARREQMLRLP